MAAQIGTDFIENQLQHTVNVNLAADHNVFFDALADDHQLVGGNGNLTITAGLTAPGNITFGHSANGANPGTNDAIVQGARLHPYERQWREHRLVGAMRSRW